jgi:hypothetical protein
MILASAVAKSDKIKYHCTYILVSILCKSKRLRYATNIPPDIKDGYTYISNFWITYDHAHKLNHARSHPTRTVLVQSRL